MAPITDKSERSNNRALQLQLEEQDVVREDPSRLENQQQPQTTTAATNTATATDAKEEGAAARQETKQDAQSLSRSASTPTRPKTRWQRFLKKLVRIHKTVVHPEQFHGNTEKHEHLFHEHAEVTSEELFFDLVCRSPTNNRKKEEQEQENKENEEENKENKEEEENKEENKEEEENKKEQEEHLNNAHACAHACLCVGAGTPSFFFTTPLRLCFLQDFCCDWNRPWRLFQS